ncbi:MAG: LamB/YcsF family protein [Oscillospiraceae bacterium]|jgi:UPF0271 protein|nr:LamB/YcsF family protein [Oscillospiraceae bacterium]
MLKIDLNCDLGESFGAYSIGMDGEVLPLISSANVACGFHASDPVVMARTVALAKNAGVAVGAHPGYPDLQGFGRRNLKVSPEELTAMVQYQIGALRAFCDANGIVMQHVKPHGAMYNMAGKDAALAEAICKGVAAVDRGLILLGLSGSMLLRAAEDCGLRWASEVFADRGYQADGSLVPRGMPGDIIHDEDAAVARVVRMVTEGRVTAVTGEDVSIRADSVCVHGDNPRALAFAQKIRDGLDAAGVAIAPLRDLIR